MKNELQNVLKEIPQVDEILKNKKFATLVEDYPHSLLVDSIREAIDTIRKDLIQKSKNKEQISKINISEIFNTVKTSLEKENKPSLRRVINATGVTLHTNFGRSILSEKAAKMVYEIAKNYNNLEYDIEKGQRGLRHIHIEKLICSLTGAESCMVVNNNAAATMIVLSSMAKGKEVITSRGELIEIGGSFRIPEVMEQSGAILKDVGTTNKTKISDYINAFNEETTAAFLKVHTSNYKIVGFTEEVKIEEMVKLGKEKKVPTIYDLGSGLMVDLSSIGIDEPSIPSILKKGVDVMMFSGDKLLGGPQAGIIIGKKKYIDLMKNNPLARILRVDKMTIAALYATLYEYFDIKRAKENIPTIKMLTMTEDELKKKANKLEKLLKEKLKNTKIEVEPCFDQAGGGSAPAVQLKGYAVALTFKTKAEKIERLMREEIVPIVIRINHDKVLIDVRCLTNDDFDNIVKACEKFDKLK